MRALFILLLLAAHAGAHAFLDFSDPPVGGKTHASPAQVSLCFTENLQAASSGARVFDAAGKRVDKGSRLDTKKARLLEITLPKLPPGAYKVIWSVLSEDSHATKGEFTFRVVLK